MVSLRKGFVHSTEGKIKGRWYLCKGSLKNYTYSLKYFLQKTLFFKTFSLKLWNRKTTFRQWRWRKNQIKTGKLILRKCLWESNTRQKRELSLFCWLIDYVIKRSSGSSTLLSRYKTHSFSVFYSFTQYHGDIERVYKMSSWTFFPEFYTFKSKSR